MIVAIDTGGTKTLFGWFKNDKLIKSKRFNTPKKYNQYLDLIRNTVFQDSEINPKDISFLSIAIPGITKDKSYIETCEKIGVKNTDIKKDILKHLNKDKIKFKKNLQIIIENDASLGCLGTIRQYKENKGRILYITISTGLGTGFAIDNQLSQISKILEGGQIIIKENKSLVKWESIMSGSALNEKYGDLPKTIKDITIKNEIAKKLGIGLNILLPLLSPDKIYFGGGAGFIIESCKEMIKKEIKPSLIHLNKDIDLILVEDCNNIVLYGCYEYAKDQYFK